MRKFAIALGVGASLLVIGLPAPVLAQNRPVSIAGGGYAFMRDYRVKENFPAGWFATAARDITSWLTGVGEVAGTYKMLDVTFDSTKYTTTTRLHTFMGGARHSWRMNGFTPFGQVLVGVAHETGGTTIFRPSIGTAETKFALQPGGGVDISLTDRFGVRLAADYRRIFADRENSDPKDNNEFRTAVGVIVGFGR